MSKTKTTINWQAYLGLILVVAGSLFLVDQWLQLNWIPRYWPLLIVLWGLSFLVGLIAGGKRSAGLAIPGISMTMLGLFLFVQNRFNLWATWFYVWALLVAAVGLGMFIMSLYRGHVGLRRAAGWIIGVGLILFLIFGGFFEIILNVSDSRAVKGVFLGGGLVLLGIFMIFSRVIFARHRKTEAPDPSPPVIASPYAEKDLPARFGESESESVVETSEAPEPDSINDSMSDPDRNRVA